jgi:hypothetical protein
MRCSSIPAAPQKYADRALIERNFASETAIRANMPWKSAAAQLDYAGETQGLAPINSYARDASGTLAETFFIGRV